MTRHSEDHEANGDPHTTTPGTTAIRAGDQAGVLGSVVLRKVATQASGGTRATVVVTVQQGAVLMSIVPPFTWEAIMAPGIVDELIGALTQARNDATAVRRRNPAPIADGRDHAR